MGVTVGQGGSEKCIWKIFYRGHPEIGTPGTPWGLHGTKIFFEKISLKKLSGYMLAGLGVIMGKKLFLPKNGYLRL